MTAVINGKTYDTEEAKYICNDPSPDGNDNLYQTAEDEFFLEKSSTFVDGRKAQTVGERKGISARTSTECLGTGNRHTGKASPAPLRARAGPV